jgi:hypothetical protein
LEAGPIVANRIGLFAQSYIVIAAIIGARTGLPGGLVGTVGPGTTVRGRHRAPHHDVILECDGSRLGVTLMV